MQPADLLTLLPEGVLLAAALVVLLMEAALRRRCNLLCLSVALGGYCVALILAWVLRAPAIHTFPMAGHGPLLAGDGFGSFFRLLVLAVGLTTVLLVPEYARERKLATGEMLSLHMLAALGMVLTARSLDLVMLFVSIELSSIGLYVLTGFDRKDRLSGEGAIKYFLLGIFATGVLVYGMAWLYGTTGSTQLQAIAAYLQGRAPSPGLVLGIFLLMVGLGFKVAAVPFHMWTPDAYEGAPTPITAFMSVGPKLAGFAALLRVMEEGLGAYREIWLPAVIVLSVLTMTLGNLAALTQSSAKRMLAYSSIAHTGYILVGLAALPAGPEALTSVLFYGAAYFVMNVGAFAVVAWVQNHGARGLIEDFSGLWRQHPPMALAITLFMLSLTGIPATVGFLGKWFVFLAAVKAGLLWLAVVGVLNSALSAYYYLRIVVNVYMKEPATTLASPPQRLTVAAVTILAALTVFLGLYWGPLYALAVNGTF
jgi:NADH-quinone oxidoreductase subunit N